MLPVFAKTGSRKRDIDWWVGRVSQVHVISPPSHTTSPPLRLLLRTWTWTSQPIGLFGPKEFNPAGQKVIGSAGETTMHPFCPSSSSSSSSSFISPQSLPTAYPKRRQIVSGTNLKEIEANDRTESILHGVASGSWWGPSSNEIFFSHLDHTFAWLRCRIQEISFFERTS